MVAVGTTALLRGDVVQHDGWDAVSGRGVRTWHSCCNVSLKMTDEQFLTAHSSEYPGRTVPE